MSGQPIGIHDISFATTHHVLDHATLAHHLGADAAKFHTGHGQRGDKRTRGGRGHRHHSRSSRAARYGTDRIRTILFATETGVDQSKAAGLRVHGLLGLPTTARVVEVKQACYSATAAPQFATAPPSATTSHSPGRPAKLTEIPSDTRAKPGKTFDLGPVLSATTAYNRQ